MTVTNDERHEVAARLRSVNGAPEWATTACCIAECLGEHDYPLWNDSKPLFNRLADLIEPEPEQTCKALKETVEVDIERDDDGLHFSCPQCGEYLGVSYEYLEERTCHVVQTTRYDYEFGYAGTEYVTELSCRHKYVDSYGDAPDYCPWCGAKIEG